MSEPTRDPLPIILVRGFGGLGVEDERRVAYQGFNDGTVYPHKRGENYIYEGLVLRFIKSNWTYMDATNVVGYYERAPKASLDIAPFRHSAHFSDLEVLQKDGFFHESEVVVDPGMAYQLLAGAGDLCKTLWILRYYDLPRAFSNYVIALKRLIQFIRRIIQLKTGQNRGVNIVAHSMGGLIVRDAITSYPSKTEAEDAINKVVTLGTPHRGITFQVSKRWIGLDASEELDRFNPHNQEDEKNEWSYKHFHRHFDPGRVLCVVGTNYRTYAVQSAAAANRLFSMDGEFGLNYNRSDGLVKQTSAQLPGSPRTFVHKCHGGFDSLVTSREAFEISTRYFFGNLKARLRLMSAKVKRGLDTFGKSEVFFGVSIKPRRVDFDLFHQSAEAENCYGPFRREENDFTDDSPEFSWAGPDRLIWEGWLDSTNNGNNTDMVFRLDFYVGERDLFGIGFSDNVIFRKQYYVRATMDQNDLIQQLWLHDNENFALPGSQPLGRRKMRSDGTGWLFEIEDSGFEARFRLELDQVPVMGHPVPISVPSQI